MIVGENLEILAQANQEFEQIYPQPGWVEHDPEAIWSSVIAAIRMVLDRAALDGKDIAAIGIANQRETTVVWERDTGKPVHRAIVWQDRRTAALCERLKQEGKEQLFRRKTGLVLDPYFSGTKLRWLLDQDPQLRRRAQAGKLACGTIDSYLVWRLTGGRSHVTDASNASRTLLMELDSLSWDPELLDALALPEALLPAIRSSSEVYGETKGMPLLADGIPIAGIAGDQQAALFGQGCFAAGDAKCTYGTGAFLLVNTGDRPVSAKSGALTTVAWQLAGKATYALEGSAFVAGAAVQWLRDGLQLIESAHEVEALARQVPDSGGVIFVPALVGLGAPHWRPEARGVLSGLTRGTTRAHLARATLEGIALQICDLIQAMERDLGSAIGAFKVDGGAAANNLLLQIQADLLQKEIVRPHVIETTALGSALLAGLAVGIWSSPAEIGRSWREDRRFRPTMDPNARVDLIRRWLKAVAAA
jgi:glycerol kinase